MSVAALDIAAVSDSRARSSHANLRIADSKPEAAGRSAHIKARRHVRPDMPRTYGAYAVRSVPENTFVYVPQRNVASPKARSGHSGASKSRVSASYVSVPRVSAPALSSARTSASRRAASVQVESRYVASWYAGAGVPEPVLTSTMKTVLLGGLLLGMMGVFFALGLHAALGVGFIG